MKFFSRPSKNGYFSGACNTSPHEPMVEAFASPVVSKNMPNKQDGKPGSVVG